MLKNELIKYRKENKKTLMDMASEIGVSMNTYILWERGINAPNEENQAKIDKLLGKGVN